MGILVRTVGDPKEWTPTYFTNTAGAVAWGGKHVSLLTAMDMVSMLEFCRAEGHRNGWNDAINGCANPDRSNPFDENLLDGYPHREWSAQYLDGVESCFEERGLTVHDLKTSV